MLYVKGDVFVKGARVGRMYIVDEERFMKFGLFFVASILLLVLFVLLAVNTVYADKVPENTDSASTPTFSRKELSYINSFEKVEIVVSRGDTAWDIQERLAPKADTRKVLYYVAKLNNRVIGDIFEGEKLIFLKAK